jgi:hypothetical protein
VILFTILLNASEVDNRDKINLIGHDTRKATSLDNWMFYIRLVPR